MIYVEILSKRRETDNRLTFAHYRVVKTILFIAYANGVDRRVVDVDNIAAKIFAGSFILPRVSHYNPFLSRHI